MRKKMTKLKDRNVFKNTANKVKAVNVTSAIERGGIRL